MDFEVPGKAYNTLGSGSLDKISNNLNY